MGTDKNTETVINATYYIEAGAFVSKEMSRYTLRGIRVEPHPEGGAVIIATDGHIMCVFHDRAGKCPSPVIIDYRTEIARLAKAPKNTIRRIKVNGELDITQDDTKTQPEKTLVRFFGAVITNSGVFPDWRAVLKAAPRSSDPTVPLDFNGQYIARCAIAKKEFRTDGVSIFMRDSTSPAVVRTQRDDFLGIVMPMRNNVDRPYPDSFQPFLPQPKDTEDKPTKSRKKSK